MDTQKLPPKFKKKWVDALMSGEYEQGAAVLCSDNKYCCLGVAEAISGSESESSYYLMGGVKVPELIKGGHAGSIPFGLASLNDAGLPFEVIAGFIQENL